MKTHLFILAWVLGAMAASADAQTIINQWPTNGSFAGGLDYDSSTDTIWVADPTDDLIRKFDRVGNPLGSFTSPRTLAIGVGVDPSSGNLWIGDESEMVDEVTPEGAPTGRCWSTFPTIVDVSGVAVDPLTGHIFVSQDCAPQVVAEFDQNGQVIRVIDVTKSGSVDPDGLAYDPTTGNFFLGEDTQCRIIEVDSEGKGLVLWDVNKLGIQPEGLGLDCAADTVFISDGFGKQVYEVSLLMTLTVGDHTVPETGGAADFVLLAGAENAGRDYLILGSISGSWPGIVLPGDKATLALKYDVFTNVVINLINTDFFKDFMETLDGQGMGTAQMNFPPVSGAAGMTMSFAYALMDPWTFTSNNVMVTVVP